MITSIDDLKKVAEEAIKTKSVGPGRQVLVSLGTCGLAAGGKPVMEALKNEAVRQGIDNSIEITDTGCMGLCHSEPTVEVVDRKTGQRAIYGNVTPAQAGAILLAGLDSEAGLSRIQKNWYYPEEEENTDNHLQARVVHRNSGRINPEVLNDYLAQDGYIGLANALAMGSNKVIATVMESGLRGRGGGGFPTGFKWKFAATQENEQKYVVCNADEGDPGAFMDRAVLEGDPHAVLEAMAITGFAIGASAGVIYIRAEYPLAIKRLEIAIEQAKSIGLLGEKILGFDFDFDIEIKYGAGAFVCGEETALIHSVEGERGEPTFKPPFPAVEGLWKKPTIVNNVETFANVCAILRQGSTWFRKLGTKDSSGTKVFALAGKIKKVGLIEVPMGTTLKDIIYGLGEGIANDKKLKAVQTGGPSGGALTADKIDTPIDYDTLKNLGSMMGSGGMIVMDEDDCMVNVAKYFLEFTLDESCGKCTPCRIGNKRLYEMLEEICAGKGTLQTIQDLKDLASVVKDTALCGLGQTSPNPVLSTLLNFEHEYLAHVNEKSCPSGVCRDLISYTINDKCIGCTLCARNCPVSCISGERKVMHAINQDACIRCGVCYDSCKFHAIDKA